MTPPEMAGWNLAFRFALELAALVGLGTAAWRLTESPYRWVAVVAVPLAAAIAWGVFNVPDDPSRSGQAPVVVPGPVRLGVELAVLGAGAGSLMVVGPRNAGIAIAILVVLHYALSLPRIEWLLVA